MLPEVKKNTILASNNRPCPTAQAAAANVKLPDDKCILSTFADMGFIL